MAACWPRYPLRSRPVGTRSPQSGHSRSRGRHAHSHSGHVLESAPAPPPSAGDRTRGGSTGPWRSMLPPKSSTRQLCLARKGASATADHLDVEPAGFSLAEPAQSGPRGCALNPVVSTATEHQGADVLGLEVADDAVAVGWCVSPKIASQVTPWPRSASRSMLQCSTPQPNTSQPLPVCAGRHDFPGDSRYSLGVRSPRPQAGQP